jgi:hypothetical protein
MYFACPTTNSASNGCHLVDIFHAVLTVYLTFTCRKSGGLSNDIRQWYVRSTQVDVDRIDPDSGSVFMLPTNDWTHTAQAELLHVLCRSATLTKVGKLGALRAGPVAPLKVRLCGVVP